LARWLCDLFRPQPPPALHSSAYTVTLSEPDAEVWQAVSDAARAGQRALNEAGRNRL
jgi:hypothetical protein